jgi:hypothetical protein
MSIIAVAVYIIAIHAAGSAPAVKLDDGVTTG